MELSTILFIYMGINQIFFIQLLIDIYKKGNEERFRSLRSFFGILFSWAFCSSGGLPLAGYIWLKMKLKRSN